MPTKAITLGLFIGILLPATKLDAAPLANNKDLEPFREAEPRSCFLSHGRHMRRSNAVTTESRSRRGRRDRRLATFLILVAISVTPLRDKATADHYAAPDGSRLQETQGEASIDSIFSSSWVNRGSLAMAATTTLSRNSCDAETNNPTRRNGIMGSDNGVAQICTCRVENSFHPL